MDRRKIKWIIGSMLLVLSVAAAALIIAKLHNKKASNDDAPGKTVTVWMLTEATYIEDGQYSDDYEDSNYRGTLPAQ